MKKLVAAVLFCASSLGHAALIDSSADPALAGGTVIDFTGMPTGSAASYTIGGVTFAATSGTLRIDPYGYGGSGWLGSGQTLTTSSLPAPSSFSITFANPVSAFGMDWGAANPSWNVSLYDAADNLLESLVFVGGSAGATFSEFYGAAHAGISKVRLTTADNGYDWVIIDDFTYVTNGNNQVPEPNTLALVALAFIGVNALRRRR